ncbi:hypothetical protein IE81DRAFT_332698 [Ceraceosorus guamensis]|uniref:Uncharacterized protein n=1 Tax=Ceraceosorus guamensis TaxID=1522189 RepID=A0A316VNN3_9BASI|nr:hypothetical protein IE81DRAFT_332698 [Ceraceosorus guamensis]PWN38930.1 hypothetical protein IE81DRAFT_332698 [Ceraceosorus guamensis]
MQRPAYHLTSSSDSGMLKYNAAPAQPPDTRGRPLRAIFWVLFKGLAVLIALLAPLCVLFWYIFKAHQAIRVGLYIYTTAPVHELLTISQVTSKIAEKVVAPAMAVFGYLCAASWLRRSELNGTYSNSTLPTPLQLGIVQTALGSANFFALSDGIKYLLGKSGHARRPKMPAFVSAAVILLCWLLTLEVLAFFADFAFHQTTVNSKVWLPPTPAQMQAETRAKSLIATPPLDWTVDPLSVTAMLLGRRVNETYCASWNAYFNDFSSSEAKNSCGYYNGAASGNLVIWAPKGQKAFANSSTTHAVAWTDDTHSIMVAPNQPAFSYSATAPGIKATCNGPHQYNGTAEATGWLDAAGNVQIDSNVPFTNPLHWGTTIISQAYVDYEGGHGSGTYDPTTGFVVWGHSGATNVLHCDVAVRLVTYRFDPPSTFKTIGTQDVNAAAAHRFVWSATDLFATPGSDLIGSIIDGAGQLASDPYPEVYSRTLSRWLMAYSAEMMSSTPLDTLEGHGVPGTRVHLVVLTVFAAIVLIECITISLVALAAAAHTWRCNDLTVRAVRKRLTGPFALLCQTYGTPRRLQPELGGSQKQACLTEDNLQLFECESTSGAHGLRLRKAMHMPPAGSPLADAVIGRLGQGVRRPTSTLLPLPCFLCILGDQSRHRRLEYGVTESSLKALSENPGAAQEGNAW